MDGRTKPAAQRATDVGTWLSVSQVEALAALTAETGTPKSHLVLMAIQAWRQAGHPAIEDTEERTIPERLSVPQADRQAINALSAELGVPISPMIRAAVAWWLTTEPQVPTWQTKGDQAQALLRELLADGPRRSDAIMQEAEARGIHTQMMQRARVALGVVSTPCTENGLRREWRLPRRAK